MKHFCAILFISLFVAQWGIAQNAQFKDERRIYLWDVTLSMKGYGGKTPDIYNQVVEALKADINSLADDATEVIILPFQVGILEEWRVKATEEGKREIISKIENYKNDKVTNTNICLPMMDVMRKYISDTQRNVLILLTDGAHTPTAEYPKSRFIELIREWCYFAAHKDVYAFYVMLTEYAHDEELIRAIKESCQITYSTGINVNFTEVLPVQTIKFNVKDDIGKPVIMPVYGKKKVMVPADMRMKIVAEENDYVEINTETTTIDNSSFMFNVKMKMSYEQLKEALPRDRNYPIKLHVSIVNPDDYPMVRLISNSIDLQLINKPEKTLRVYVQD